MLLRASLIRDVEEIITRLEEECRRKVVEMRVYLREGELAFGWEGGQAQSGEREQ